ncbi:fluoride efflux transporter CrcB [Thiolinea disciformis]|uniref:fluoride efflux transporter CrcB n=1 Tax=Thiolinea disciformis TaxID=125614 RepID=UPI00038206EF|nr:fluoride efflux transporter CrcB [Thiolinea disciformis]
MASWLAILVGGAFGALLRYGTIQGIQQVLGKGFPYGTLTVNVLGSFALGYLAFYFGQRDLLASAWYRGLAVGVLGAFTTFSTFSLDTVNLLAQGDLTKGLLNIGLNVGLCLLAVSLGIFTAKGF